jgi:hypothetical protein
MRRLKQTICTIGAAALLACGGGESSDDGPVPSDVPPLVRQQYVAYDAPPSSYKVIVPWLTAIHDERSAGGSRIDVKYLRAYCKSATETRLVTSYEYVDQRFEGGLWQRRPNWFQSGYVGALPHGFDAGAGTVYFTPSSLPSAAWHLWGPRGSIPNLSQPITKCWTEASVQVSGPGLIQAGLDYYASLNGGAPLEAGVSNWFFAAAGWQSVTWNK